MIWAKKYQYLGWTKIRYLLACYLPYFLMCSSFVCKDVSADVSDALDFVGVVNFSDAQEAFVAE